MNNNTHQQWNESQFPEINQTILGNYPELIYFEEDDKKNLNKIEYCDFGS